jgi:hypothetical protein
MKAQSCRRILLMKVAPPPEKYAIEKFVLLTQERNNET